MARIEDILFWILILVVIGIAIWLAFGSPDFENGLIAIVIFVASSEILLWKTLFTFDKKSVARLSSIDKRTSIGFERVKLDFERVNDKLQSIKNDINEIKSNIIGINKKLKIK